MKKVCTFLVTVLCSGAVCAAGTGDYFIDLTGQANMGFRDDAAGDGKGGWTDQGPTNDLRAFDVRQSSFLGVPFRIVDPEKNGGNAILTFTCPEVAVTLDEAVFKFEKPVSARYLYVLHTMAWNASTAGVITLDFQDGKSRSFEVRKGRDIGSWWNPVDEPNAFVAFRADRGGKTVGLHLSQFMLGGNTARVSAVRLKTFGTACWLVAGVTLSATDYPLPRSVPWQVQEGDEWKRLKNTSGVIKESSALDMSRYIEAPAGKYGRVIRGRNGRLVFEKMPEKRAVFFCAALGSDFGRTHEEIEDFVLKIKRQGYNMVRPHNLDAALASTEDLVLRKDNLDRWDYAVSCLKKNGIYIFLDGMTYTRNHMRSTADKGTLHTRVYYDQSARDYWKKYLDLLLTHENPYTKTRLVDDPVIVAILYLNEHNGRIDQPGMLPVWRGWLKKKYGTDKALRKAWGDPSAGLENVPLFEPSDPSKPTPYGKDVRLFTQYVYADMNVWFEKAIRGIGYKGLVTYYDWLMHLNIQAVRNGVELISIHSYHNHPTRRSEPGSSMRQESAIGTGGRYFTSGMLTRYVDRPFIFSEYGHPFWSRYRYEEALLFAGYAGLNDVDGINAWALPVVDDLNRMRIEQFQAGIDPVRRVTQVVAGLMLRERLVTPSPHLVEVPLSDKYIIEDNHFKEALESRQSKLALLCAAGISFPGAAAPAGITPVPVSLSVPPFGTSATRNEKMYSEVLENGVDSGGLESAVKAMREKGILPAGNRTDVAKGIFESDTGELYLESPRNLLAVTAPCVEGACLDTAFVKEPVKLKALTVQETSVSASVTALSLDGQPLASSSRLLLCYATDALPKGITFTSDKKEKIVGGGGTPALVRTGKLSISVENGNAARLKAWALAFNGERLEELPVKAKGNILHFSVDTAKLKDGPAAYFEFAEK